MTESGMHHLYNPRLNKGTAFTPEERVALGLTGLLPPHVSTMAQQIERNLNNLNALTDPIDKYLYLIAMQKRNERLFYRLLIDNIEALMPTVYTPTVGRACQEYTNLYRETSGFYVSFADRGNIHDLLSHWPETDVRLIVVTDGERILGLGDLGSNGMGIPIGKLALYCACAGIKPEECMPVMLDVGTQNQSFLDDPFYLGLSHERVRGEEYFSFVEEFIDAVTKRYPKALLQFEDFATPNAITLLGQYRDKLLCFNDDIQGTAAVALAGLFASTRITQLPLSEMRFLFVGAGSAASGIGTLLSTTLQRGGLSAEKANSHLSFVDVDGLVSQSRAEIPAHMHAFASSHPTMDLQQAIEVIKPHAIIGATGTAGVFNQKIIETMSEQHKNPIIFALSNPTANAECTAEQAYRWSQGRAIFASGSPFDVIHINGEIKVPGQGNNAYIFPGLGLGALQSGARRINDSMLISAAHALAQTVSQDEIDHGCLYPPLRDIRNVSAKIAVAVAYTAQKDGLLEDALPEDFEKKLLDEMYDPYY